MDATQQPELFSGLQESPRRRGGTIGHLQIRQDHAVLAMIVGLIGLSVVFAVGVERGKQVAQAEHPLLDSHATVVSPRGGPSAEAPSDEAKANADSSSERVTDAPSRRVAPQPKTVPNSQRKAPKAVAGQSRTRYAVQVVSYTRPTLANQELQRLKEQGEQAFLIVKPDRMALLIGPFPSKSAAATKLATLKRRYQDCFIQNL